MKEIKRSKTLKGLFWPKYHRDVMRIISQCEIVFESIKNANFEDIVNLDFNLKKGDKMTIYREFIRAIKNGWVRVEQRTVIRYLAENSNLASSDTLDKRINAIRQGFKRYKKHFS